MNFDSEHVDLKVVRKGVELIGTRNIIAMTERIDTAIMCGQKLKKNGRIIYSIKAKIMWLRDSIQLIASCITFDRLVSTNQRFGS